MRGLRRAVALAVFAAVLTGIPGCRSKPSLVLKESYSLLTQDVNRLTGTNGLIVEQRGFRIESQLRNGVDCHRIVYRSDGLRVVGYGGKTGSWM